MKKYAKRMLCAVLVVSILFGVEGSVEAKSYSYTTVQCELNKQKKCGYYFKSNSNLYISKKSSGFKKIVSVPTSKTISSAVITNGKYLYYGINDSKTTAVYKKNIKSKSTKKYMNIVLLEALLEEYIIINFLL